MRKAPLPALFLVAILVAASVRAADPPRRTTESAIEEITRLLTVEWPQAIARHDVQWFDHHLADELLQTANDELTTKTEAMASVRASQGAASTTTEIEDLRVNAYGDVAVTAFQLHVSGTDNDRPLHRTVRYTETWVFRDGRWQLVASHSSVLPLPSCGPAFSPGHSTTLPRPEEEVTKEVAAAEAAFHQAMLAGDATKLESLLDDTFVRTFRDGSQQTRREALEEVRSGRLKFTRLETNGVTINVYGDAAVVRGTSLRQRSAVPGTEADVAPFQLFYTMTLVNRGGTWKVVALHASHS